MSAAPDSCVTTSADALVAEYEQLRHIALGRATGRSRGVGFALLLRSGMAAWMEQCMAVPSVPKPWTPQQEQQNRLLASPLRGEVAMVLASMALAVEGGMST